MEKEKINKKGQVALFVIIALVIVGGIILFYAIRNMPKVSEQVVFNPQQEIEKCTQDAVNEATDIMLPQGGFLKPTNVKWYNYTNVTYLCENSNDFLHCVNQHPMLLNEMKNEIKNYITPTVEQCFASMQQDAENKNYIVELGAMSLNVSLMPERVFVNIIRETKITKNEQTQIFDKYDIGVINPAYDLAVVAMDIANDEARSCAFDSVVYMMTHQRFDIRNTIMSDSTKIYFIHDNNSGKTMKIATRSCG